MYFTSEAVMVFCCREDSTDRTSWKVQINYLWFILIAVTMNSLVPVLITRRAEYRGRINALDI